MNRRPGSTVRSRTAGRRHGARRRKRPAEAPGDRLEVSQEPAQEPAATLTPEAAEGAEAALHDQRTFRVRVAVLIAVCSIAGVLSAWQASLKANEASELDQQGMQHLVHKEQELNKIDGLVDQDKRIGDMHDEHVNAMQLLEDEARQVADSYPELAEALRVQAREEHTLARSLRRFFLTYRPEGDEAVDDEEATDSATYRDEELKELRPRAILAQADKKQEHARYFEALTALFAVSLFLLTLAELARSGIRRYFAVSGGVVVAGGLIAFAVALAVAP